LARDILRFCDEARRRRLDVIFGADVIAGFPTENDQAHQANLAIIAKADITHLHVFPYSPRPGTPAAAMPQTPALVIKQRAAELRALGAARLGSFLEGAIGKRDQLLVEAGNRGHGRNFAKIRLAGDFIPSGQLVDVELIGRDGDSLVGRAVAKGAQSA
jgi:threonylcarbamoyladenosine tRNA methylthiotransferase MtaB